MTSADALAILRTIAAILQTMGAWPLGLVLLVVILGPWVMMGCVAWALLSRAASHDTQSVEMIGSIREQFSVSVRTYETRHAEAVQMYKDNVELVKGYSKLAEDQAAVIHLNTQAMTRLVDKIKVLLRE